jgi:hypothetical protein
MEWDWDLGMDVVVAREMVGIPAVGNLDDFSTAVAA